MTTVHFLKSHPDAYRKAASGEKTLEVRKDDRTPRYETGDIVILEHYRPATPETHEDGTWTYMGEHVTKRIGYVERGPHVPPGYCAFALVHHNVTKKDNYAPSTRPMSSIETNI